MVPFIIGLVTIVFLLVKLDLPAFLGLIIATFIVGIVTPEIPIGQVPEELAANFAATLQSIGIPILMAAIIGKTIMESGAAERIVRVYLALTGEERAEISMLGSGFFLAIPVFFASVFYLLAPIARSMRERTNGHLALYISALGAGAAAAHGLVLPTPGPLAVTSRLRVNFGLSILVGLCIAFVSAISSGLIYGRWIDQRLDVPHRDAMGADRDDLVEMTEQDVDDLPGFVEAALPIILAVVLIIFQTVTSAVLPKGTYPLIMTAVSFLGSPNFALTLAAIASTWTYYRFSTLNREELSDELTEAVQFGGRITAIVGAGGAFGALLATSGIGDYIASVMATIGLPLLVTGWLIAALVRVAQGSATVALLTAAEIMKPLLDQLSVHPVYMVMAIGSGGVFLSWYNDGGFWIVNELGGLSQSETLKTWSMITVIQSVVGLLATLLMANALPLT